MKINTAEFIKSAPRLADAPDFRGLPEIAFVGRSNVGKSSLINSLLRRKGLAKTSNTPGKTRLINFYQICYSDRKKEIIFADLPGYGYAKVSKTEQAQWGKNLEEYLTQRPTLRFAVQLIDSRHGPQVSDMEMLAWLHLKKLPVILVLTKTDKISKNDLHQQLINTERHLDLAKLPAELYPVVAYSAENNHGRDALWHLLLND